MLFLSVFIKDKFNEFLKLHFLIIFMIMSVSINRTFLRNQHVAMKSKNMYLTNNESVTNVTPRDLKSENRL